MRRRYARILCALMFAALAFPSHGAAPALAPWTGGATPALALNDVQGAVHDLAQYRGQVVLINFWATWCEPCREEMPSMQRLRERLSGKGFTVLAVNVDEPEARVRRFVTENRLDLPVLVDRNKNITRAWGVRVMPSSFLVGPDGRIRYRVVGEIDWMSDAVIDAVSRLMTRR
jgi:peroxiredoxin